MQFADVMARGGFDCVIGNPPWVRHSLLEPETRGRLAARYPAFRGSGGLRQSDLCIAFVERSIELAAPAGVVSLLLPAKVLNASYASTLRRHIERRRMLAAIHDWSGEGRTMFAADTFPLGLTLRKDGASDIVLSAREQVTRRKSVTVSAESSIWSVAPSEIADLTRLMRDAHPPLREALGRRPLMGVKSGDNGFFILPDAPFVRGSLLVDGTAVPASALCRLIRGRNIRRWTLLGSSWMLWAPDGRFDTRSKWLMELAEKCDRPPETIRLSYVRPEHLAPKVIWKDVATRLEAVVAPDRVSVGGREFPLVPNQTTYFLDASSVQEAHFLAALLNSTPVTALLRETAESAKDDHYRFFASVVADLPFPEANDTVNAQLARLSRAAHSGEAVQTQIDEVVARLYGLSGAEITMLGDYTRVDR